ncbi:MAG: hypothetical protein GY765_32940 [bacterium]|nr:hypothetical protein [bacterium]
MSNKKAFTAGLFALLLFITFPFGIHAENIHDAAYKGEMEKVANFLAQNPKAVNLEDESGFTPLQIAAYYGKDKIVRLLLDKGADVKANNNSRNWSPLYAALLNGKKETIDMLLEKNAASGLSKAEGPIILHAAVTVGHTGLVDILTPKGSEIDCLRYGFTPLHTAASKGKPDVTALLIKKGAGINQKSAQGKTAFNLAKEAGYKDIAALLIAKGADKSPAVFPVFTGPYPTLQTPGTTPQLFAPGIVSKQLREHSSISFSPDGKRLFFTIQEPKPDGGTNQEIFSMERIKSRWTAPAKVPFNTPFIDCDGAFLPGTKRFYFNSRRPLTPGGEAKKDSDIWYVDLKNDGWGTPVNIGPPVNTSMSDGSPSFTDHRTMYFHSSRGNADRTADIYRSKFQKGVFMEPEKLCGKLNTEKYEAAPYIAPDESFIMFYRIDIKDTRKKSLILSFRNKQDQWSEPVDLKEKLGLKGNDLLMGSLSPDGKYLFILDAADIYWMKASVIEKLRPKGF